MRKSEIPVGNHNWFSPFQMGSFRKCGLAFKGDAITIQSQRAKKVVSDSPGLVDFAIGLVNSVFTLPTGQVMFFEEFK